MKKEYIVFDYCGCGICQNGGVCHYRGESFEYLTESQLASKMMTSLVRNLDYSKPEVLKK